VLQHTTMLLVFITVLAVPKNLSLPCGSTLSCAYPTPAKNNPRQWVAICQRAGARANFHVEQTTEMHGKKQAHDRLACGAKARADSKGLAHGKEAAHGTLHFGPTTWLYRRPGDELLYSAVWPYAAHDRDFAVPLRRCARQRFFVVALCAVWYLLCASARRSLCRASGRVCRVSTAHGREQFSGSVV
jgi:hypothetical protein